MHYKQQKWSTEWLRSLQHNEHAVAAWIYLCSINCHLIVTIIFSTPKDWKIQNVRWSVKSLALWMATFEDTWQTACWLQADVWNCLTIARWTLTMKCQITGFVDGHFWRYLANSLLTLSWCLELSHNCTLKPANTLLPGGNYRTIAGWTLPTLCHPIGTISQLHAEVCQHFVTRWHQFGDPWTLFVSLVCNISKTCLFCTFHTHLHVLMQSSVCIGPIWRSREADWWAFHLERFCRCIS